MDDDEDESEKDEESESVEEESQKADASEESGSGSEEEVDEEDESGDDSKEWDEYCYVCNDGGNMLCCEGCTKVAHASCASLKIAPKGAWHCKDCAAKLVQKKQASRAAATLANGRAGTKGSSRDGHMPTRTSSRSRRAASRK